MRISESDFDILKQKVPSLAALDKNAQKSKKGSGRRGRNKYNVSPREDRTFQGVVYHSKRECRYAQQLESERLASGGKMWWCRQCKFPLEGGVHWIADFVVYREGETTQVIDCKGYKTSEYIRCKKQVEARYGITVIET